MIFRISQLIPQDSIIGFAKYKSFFFCDFIKMDLKSCPIFLFSQRVSIVINFRDVVLLWDLGEEEGGWGCPPEYLAQTILKVNLGPLKI